MFAAPDPLLIKWNEHWTRKCKPGFLNSSIVQGTVLKEVWKSAHFPLITLFSVFSKGSQQMSWNLLSVMGISNMLEVFQCSGEHVCTFPEMHPFVGSSDIPGIMDVGSFNWGSWKLLMNLFPLENVTLTALVMQCLENNWNVYNRW